MANVGFLRDDRLLWPTGPTLLGIGQQLLTDAAIDAGLRTEPAPVLLDEIDAFDAAFTVNSVGVVPVERIDDHRFAASERRVRPLVELHDSLGWDPLAS